MSAFGLPERFVAKVEVSETCWNWTGCKTKAGYGRWAVRPPSLKTY